jgi:hypothetical protein
VLDKIVAERDIKLNKRRNLIRVVSSAKKAYFEVLDEEAKPTGNVEEFAYDLLHVAPPCSPIKAFRELKDPLTGMKF